jgi:Protein of unknown function (DUF3572)
LTKGKSYNAKSQFSIEALAFLAKDPARLECFLVLSGVGLDNLRAAAEPGFLAAVLDHLASDEGLLLAFAAQAKQNPEDIAKARELLSPPSETP